jgi:hypothetical protein
MMKRPSIAAIIWFLAFFIVSIILLRSLWITSDEPSSEVIFDNKVLHRLLLAMGLFRFRAPSQVRVSVTRIIQSILLAISELHERIARESELQAVGR